MNNHDPKYRELMDRLHRVQSLAREEALVTSGVTGELSWSAADCIAARDLKRAAMDEVQPALAELERAGVLTRAGAYSIASIFTCAAYASVYPQSPEGKIFGRLLRWAWRIEHIVHAVRRWTPRSAS